ncbi:hypothetical protein CROQUDRAFT_652835 [Cronartium quercuum f. sp. fusiforme G11]|uniref:Uncharacterized protein n=1 Tax=Cronartium quercuum f. sp. fusiforme G11 TaxID=708437 RepID=A0A9P6TF79_9BASI|nr:hypothetical protein CROQUDRAFT_652835 [Cronartium quercuum f. sp. fusiforme G11]
MLTADDFFDVGIYKEAIPPSSHWLLLSEIPLLILADPLFILLWCLHEPGHIIYSMDSTLE